MNTLDLIEFHFCWHTCNLQLLWVNHWNILGWEDLLKLNLLILFGPHNSYTTESRSVYDAACVMSK